MKLPFKLPFGKKEKKEYFLALLLREEKVNAVIFEEIAGKIQVIGEHEEYFSTTIEHLPTNELLEILDDALSQAESELPKNVETQKTIFGVKEDWVEGANIKKEYLAKLKKISDALGLTPIGFLVIQEAIAHLMQKEEGAPVSAILLEVGKQNLAISLLRAGRIIETKRTKIEDDIPTTTDRILHHFTNYEVLPSRIVIFDDKNAEELSQDFISHPWSKVLPFLHVPQITVLPKGFDARAVLFGAATQMGFEVLNDEVQQEIFSQEVPLEKKEDTEKKEIAEEKVVKKPLVSDEDFGFVKGRDIAPTHAKKIAMPLSQEEEITETKREIIEENIAIPTMPNATKPSLKTFIGSLHKKGLPSLLSSVSFLPALLAGTLGNVFTIIKQPTTLLKRGKIFVIPPLIIGVVLLFLLLYIFGLKSIVFLSFRPKVIEDKQNVLFSAGKPTQAENNQIQATLFEVEKEGSQSIPATGKKEVGEKAKGAVTIYSNLTREQTFAKDTTITSSNGLTFILTESVKVASSSGASDGQKTTKVNVIAKNIGKESNLPSGTKFTVNAFEKSEVEAKNDTAFSGGSKKELTVVTKKDVDKASEELLLELEKKAKEDAAKKIGDDEELLPVFLSSSLTKKELSHDIGDETESFTLKSTASFQGISYKKADLDAYAKKVLTTKQNNMIFSDNGITYNVEKTQKKNENEVSAIVTIKASLIPKIDTTKLAESVAGKSFEDTESILIKLPQASDVRIQLVPNIPLLPKMLPRISKNITFFVETHD